MCALQNMSGAVVVVCLLAEAVVQSLLSSKAENKAFAITSTQGDGPGQDASKWEQLFGTAQ